MKHGIMIALIFMIAFLITMFVSLYSRLNEITNAQMAMRIVSGMLVVMLLLAFVVLSLISEIKKV